MAKRPNRDDLEIFHTFDVYTPSRTIYLGSVHVSVADGESGCDASLAERTAKNLHFLESLSQDPITVVLNNPGGELYQAMAIVDSIRACKSEVIVKVVGVAMSAGSIILQAADKRIVTPNSTLMVHYGQGSVEEDAKTFQKAAKEHARLDRWMENLYLSRIQEKHPTFRRNQIVRLLTHDTYFTAQESVAMGLADEVETP